MVIKDFKKNILNISDKTAKLKVLGMKIALSGKDYL